MHTWLAVGCLVLCMLGLLIFTRNYLIEMQKGRSKDEKRA